MEIFVVQGSTGEYSDRTERLVRAFKTEEAAQAFIALLEETYRSFPARGSGGQRSDWKELWMAMSPLDPEFEEDYTGTCWYYERVTLADS